ncbi:MAG: hypothetical protein COB46_11105 [Rhodospirillaceae bacterium]|nr:MAG: hypothetical protein COB46_11105 [Rhodospirillaceae bacterium]
MRSLILGAAFVLSSLSPAFAGSPFPTISDPVVRAECSDCHMLYQPEMLTKQAWAKMFADLSNHFGDDATLPAETAKLALDVHLAQAADVSTHRQAKRFIKAADGKSVPMRITDTSRFAHKHERILPEVFKRKQIGLKSNCISCHLKADKGDYDFVAKNIKYIWVE